MRRVRGENDQAGERSGLVLVAVLLSHGPKIGDVARTEPAHAVGSGGAAPLVLDPVVEQRIPAVVSTAITETHTTPAQPEPERNDSRLSSYTDPDLYLHSRFYNPANKSLSAEQRKQLVAVIQKANGAIDSKQGQILDAADSHVRERIAAGLTNHDPQDGAVDRIGTGELRLFVTMADQHYYLDFVRGQEADLDALYLERDALVHGREVAVVDFFQQIP